MAPSHNQVSQATPTTNNTTNTDAVQMTQDGHEHQSATEMPAHLYPSEDEFIPTLDAVVDDAVGSDGGSEMEERGIKDIERESVRLEVEDLMAPWAKCLDEPPFTAAELIVIACLSSTGPCLTKSEILSKLIHAFPYYLHLAVDEYVFGQVEIGVNDDAVHLSAVIEGFEEAFDLWDVPLVEFEGDDLVHWPEDGEDSMEITVPPRAGRSYLSRWLDPERKGSFRFLDLPAEIRNHIYGMVFTLPSMATVKPPSCPKDKKFQLCVSRRFEDSDAHGNQREPQEDEDENEGLEVGPGKILALLLVNKQIYLEAMPIFYGANSFVCKTLGDVCALIHATPARRMKHFRYLTLDLACEIVAEEFDNFVSAMSKLQAVETLNTLEITGPDYHWLTLTKSKREQWGRTSKFTSFGQIPGFRNLAVVCSRAKVLTIEDGKFKTWVNAEIKRIREQGEGVMKQRRSNRTQKAATKAMAEIELEEIAGKKSRKN